jgi:serine/threonine-protein kinase
LREGPYWFLVELGRGSTAEVFLAAGEGLVGFEKLHVVKRLKRDLADEPEFVEMFLDEGRLAARLNHPNIIRTIEVAESSGRPYIVMEYLEGRSVYELVHAVAKGRLTVEREHWIAIAAEVLSALDYAHGFTDFDGSPLGIVHRDVSPGNVLVGYAGEVKLTDFGIAKAALRSGTTAVGTIKGKARYMAPEQIAGGAIDGRADVFATGVMLWELLAGRPPWKQWQDPTRRGPAPPLSSAVAGIPAELDAICGRALHEDSRERVQSAGAMLDALESFMTGQGRRVSRRELGTVVSAGFEAERATRNTIVRQQLLEMRQVREHGGLSLAELPQASESIPPEPTSVSVHPSPALRGSKLRRVYVFALALGVGALAGALFLSNRREPQGAPTRSIPADSPPAPAPSASERPAAPDVELYIVALPAEAVITVDGVPLASNPYSARVPIDARVHRVHVAAPGHEEVEREIRYDRPVTLRIKLHPTAPRRAK